MKRFVVTGTPRSGTTFLCNRLASLDNVHMDSNYDYEPFSPYAGVLDEEDYLDNLVTNHPGKIVGLKTWWYDSYDFTGLIEDFDPIVLIRKDVQKVFLSLIVLLRFGYDENKSSKNQAGSSELVYGDFGLRYNAHNLLKSYCYSEKMPYLEKIYFEDLVDGSYDPTSLEDYFENKLDLNTNYKESVLTDYYQDPGKFIRVLRDTALSMDHKKFPDYVRENLNI